MTPEIVILVAFGITSTTAILMQREAYKHARGAWKHMGLDLLEQAIERNAKELKELKPKVDSLMLRAGLKL